MAAPRARQGVDTERAAGQVATAAIRRLNAGLARRDDLVDVKDGSSLLGTLAGAWDEATKTGEACHA